MPPPDPSAGIVAFDPTRNPEMAKPDTTIPALAAYRDNPTAETHQRAAELLNKYGPLVLDGAYYALVGGFVRSGPPPRNPAAVSDEHDKITY